MNIFLAGYMGSGKSMIGKQLAEKMGMTFIDLDAVIEQQFNSTITELISKGGETDFREKEHNCLKEIVKSTDSVIALGGGAPCFYNNMELANQHGITVYLKLSADSLYLRLVKDREHRPLIKNKTDKELKSFITESLAQREPFYSKATYKVKAKDLDVTVLADFLKTEAVQKV